MARGVARDAGGTVHCMALSLISDRRLRYAYPEPSVSRGCGKCAKTGNGRVGRRGRKKAGVDMAQRRGALPRAGL